MAKVGHIEVEVRPTVTLESAAACVMMLNLFLDGNDGYDLVCVDSGDGFRWELTDEPKPGLSKTIRDMNKAAGPKIRIETKEEYERRIAETHPFDGDLSAWPSPPNE